MEVSDQYNDRRREELEAGAAEWQLLSVRGNVAFASNACVDVAGAEPG
jgi:hypothetical protein